MLRHIWLLPLAAFLVMPVSFFVSYGVAVGENHTEAVWPFISDTIALAPESCYFGELLNLGAVFLGLCVYLRHRQIVAFYRHGLGREGGGWRRVSTGLLWLGLASAFGTSMVANFQETRVMTMHKLGALLAFGCGIVYGWGQTGFSYAMRPRMASLLLSHLRLALTLAATGLFVLMNMGGFVRGDVPKHADRFHWSSSDPGYGGHLMSTFSEWSMVICFSLFILSFAWELRHIHRRTSRT